MFAKYRGSYGVYVVVTSATWLYCYRVYVSFFFAKIALRGSYGTTLREKFNLNQISLSSTVFFFFLRKCEIREIPVTRHMLRRQLLRHWYLSGDRVILMGMIWFLVQGTVKIRIRVRVRVRVRVYVSFNIQILWRSICRRSICHGTKSHVLFP